MKPQKTEEDLFTQYFTENVAPLIEQTNKLKEKYRSRFWGSLWTMIFLICVNALFVLFNTLIYFHPFNTEQLILVAIAAILIVLLPLWQYHKLEQQDFLDAFLKFYGNNWQHIMPTEKRKATNATAVLPIHDAEQICHAAVGSYLRANIIISDVVYWLKSQKTSSGVCIEVTWPQKTKHEVLLFAKNGFYRKNKWPDMNLLNEQILIPAAAYFNIFAPQQHAPKKLLCSPFFEKVLDLRDVFKARKIYISLQSQKMIIYLENSQMYFEQNGIWQHKIKNDKFKLLHQQFTEIFAFIELLLELYARDK